MPHYIVTGNYTAAAMKGMIAQPSDREAAARAIIEAGGGKMLTFLVTTGEHDFLAITEAPSSENMLASLIAIGSSGAVSNLKTVLAFTSAEFLAAQTRAGGIVASYRPPA